METSQSTVEESAFLDDFSESVGSECEPECETPDVEVSLLPLAQEFGLLNEKKRELKKQLEDVEERMKEIDSQICERMIFENPNLKVRIGEDSKGRPKFKTVYVTSTLWAGYADNKEALVEAMKESGMGDMVSESFNTQTLSAYVRGLDPDNSMTLEELKAALPEKVQPHIKLTTKSNIKVKS